MKVGASLKWKILMRRIGQGGQPLERWLASIGKDPKRWWRWWKPAKKTFSLVTEAKLGLIASLEVVTVVSVR